MGVGVAAVDAGFVLEILALDEVLEGAPVCGLVCHCRRGEGRNESGYSAWCAGAAAALTKCGKIFPCWDTLWTSRRAGGVRAGERQGAGVYMEERVDMVIVYSAVISRRRARGWEQRSEAWRRTRGSGKPYRRLGPEVSGCGNRRPLLALRPRRRRRRRCHRRAPRRCSRR